MSVISLISKCVLLLGLAAAALEDLRTGKVHLILTAVLFSAGLALQIADGQMGFIKLLLGVAVGAGLTLISFASRGGIGIGDGLMFAASGAFLGLSDNLLLLLFSLSLSSVTSVILIITLKYRGKNRIPFIPFMFAGYICLLMII